MIKPICTVPAPLVEAAITEVLAQRAWIPGARGALSAFSTSTIISLRDHDLNGPTVPGFQGPPKTSLEYGNYLTAKDTHHALPACRGIVSFVSSHLSASEVGLARLVRLEARGSVPLHIDLGAYYQRFRRFHVPLITNRGVLFSDENGDTTHVQAGELVELLNRELHAISNHGDEARIHLIVDLQVM